MIKPTRFKALCLSLEGATEAPHMERTAFRARKIFATLPPDGRTANLLLTPDLQAAVIEAMPHAFSPVPGGWGRMGFTTVDLTNVTEAALTPVLHEAHALASEPAPRKARAKTKASKTSAKKSSKKKSGKKVSARTKSR